MIGRQKELIERTDATLGPQAERITAGHVLEEGFGEAGPLGRLYELGARL